MTCRKVHISQLYTQRIFTKWLHLLNNNMSQEIKCYQHHWNFSVLPSIIITTPKGTAVLNSTSIDQFYCYWGLCKWNHAGYTAFFVHVLLLNIGRPIHAITSGWGSFSLLYSISFHGHTNSFLHSLVDRF